jgi:hypothetical protein
MASHRSPALRALVTWWKLGAAPGIVVADAALLPANIGGEPDERGNGGRHAGRGAVGVTPPRACSAPAICSSSNASSAPTERSASAARSLRR